LENNTTAQTVLREFSFLIKMGTKLHVCLTTMVCDWYAKVVNMILYCKGNVAYHHMAVFSHMTAGACYTITW